MNNLAILTVTRNDAHGLEKTIKSVIDQDLGCFKHYIQDGSSCDFSKTYSRYVKDYISSINKVFYCSDKDEGIYDAMNKLCEKVEEEYVLFLNSGDCFLNSSVLRRIMSILAAKKESDHVIFPWIYEHSGTRVSRSPLPSFLIISQMTFCHQACISKASRLAGKPFKTSYAILADWDFFCRETIGGARFCEITTSQTLPIVVFDATGRSSTSYLLMLYDAIRISFAQRLFRYQALRLSRNLFKLFLLIPISFLFKYKAFFLAKRYIVRRLDSKRF